MRAAVRVKYRTASPPDPRAGEVFHANVCAEATTTLEHHIGQAFDGSFNGQDCAIPFDASSAGARNEYDRPLAARCGGAIPQQGLSGRLVVNVALLFSKVRAGAAEANADVSTSILTLYDMDLPFTRAALKQAPGR